MRQVLRPQFFRQPTLVICRGLLGKYLVRRIGRREIASPITEVEAYSGFVDRASHASRGMTPRNKVMFGPAGVWYIYFTYGMHWMINIVTGREGYPAAVLIRGVEGISGPARVAKFFGIDKRWNHKPAGHKSGLWVEDRGIRPPRGAIGRGKRIGVDYAGGSKDKLWRFFLLR